MPAEPLGHSQGGVRMVQVMFPDLNALACGKLVPIQKFNKSIKTGFNFARSALVQDIEGENVLDARIDIASGDSDVTAVPDMETFLELPWKPGRAQVIIEPQDRSSGSVPQSCRTLLKSVQHKLSQAGFEAKVAIELEFYLFEKGQRMIGQGLPAYRLLDLTRHGQIIDQLIQYTEALGLEVEACLHEYAPGQLEINFAPLPPLEMADKAFYFRNMVKEVAILNGLEATFLAKPVPGQAGNGCHIHASLWKDGSNAFWQNGKRSSVFEQFASGCVRYAPDVFLAYAPTPNSFRRFIPGEYVPTEATYGGDNRLVAFRTPEVEGEAARLENRIPCADANPYIALAAFLMSGLEGIERNLSMPDSPPAKLPPTMHQALEAFSSSSFCRSALNEAFVDAYTAVKRQELRKFSAVITDWEMRTYGQSL